MHKAKPESISVRRHKFEIITQDEGKMLKKIKLSDEAQN